MDKYQANLINRGTFSLLATQGNGTAVIEGNTLTLTQNENYEIIQYILRLENDMVASVKVGNKLIEQKNGYVEAIIDFAKQVGTLEIVFKNDFAEPCKLTLKYVMADKGRFDEKRHQEQQSQYKEAMHFMCRTGLDLVNIYWQNASENVDVTVIEFFAVDGEINMLIEKQVLSKDHFFYAIKNLAYGQYRVVITQKDSERKTIIEDNASIRIEDPFAKLSKELGSQLSEVKSQVRVSGRHTVVI